MARKKRNWYEGAQMHITTRGNRKEKIFLEDSDYNSYLTVVKDTIDHFEGKFKIISYCLMNNHVHLQIQTSDIPIGNFMRRINTRYAQRFNSKYGLTGHLFQGRYGSELIENTKYSLDASRYIHLNPVKAKIVRKPEEYKWSSYKSFIWDIKDPLVKEFELLKYFNTKNKDNILNRITSYATYIDDKVSSEREKQQMKTNSLI